MKYSCHKIKSQSEQVSRSNYQVTGNTRECKGKTCWMTPSRCNHGNPDSGNSIKQTTQFLQQIALQWEDEVGWGTNRLGG